MKDNVKRRDGNRYFELYRQRTRVAASDKHGAPLKISDFEHAEQLQIEL